LGSKNTKLFLALKGLDFSKKQLSKKTRLLTREGIPRATECQETVLKVNMKAAASRAWPKGEISPRKGRKRGTV